jgi:tetratricopeptide (TPR) repeat protein
LRNKAGQAFLLCCVVAAWPVSLGAQQPLLAEAENLFAERDRGDALKQAISLLESSMKQDPSNYQVLWRLSKYKYYLSDRENGGSTKIRLLEQAIDCGKRAVRQASKRPEGHFWLAVSYGSYAELKGVFTSLWLLKTVREEFETVFKIDANYENGSVYLALGEMDLRLPWLLGGNTRRGVSRLESGLKVSPRNSELMRFLGETYIRAGKNEEGRHLLQTVLTLDDPCRSPKELAEIRSRAQREIKKLR